MTLTYHPKLSSLLAYPSQDVQILERRAQELATLGVTALIVQGDEVIDGLSIIGKGYCGLVMLAQWQSPYTPQTIVALKVRRTDAPKSSFANEALHLAIANTLNIGPTLHNHSQNYLVMAYLSGPTLYHWLLSQPSAEEVKVVLRDLLWQCYRLDQSGIDHGNLRCITEHVLIERHRPVIIDFSSSSRDRRPANVTTLLQGILWGTVISSALGEYIQIPSKDTLVPILREYKQSLSSGSLDQILQILHLALA